MVRRTGLEPAQVLPHNDLNVARIPIPPPALIYAYYNNFLPFRKKAILTSSEIIKYDKTKEITTYKYLTSKATKPKKLDKGE